MLQKPELVVDCIRIVDDLRTEYADFESVTPEAHRLIYITERFGFCIWDIINSMHPPPATG